MSDTEKMVRSTAHNVLRMEQNPLEVMFKPCLLYTSIFIRVLLSSDACVEGQLFAVPTTNWQGWGVTRCRVGH